jgi:hypothetical protein
MRILILIFLPSLFTASYSNAQKQKPFSGRLIYSIEVMDTSLSSLFPKKEMKIYTNDTLVRAENFTDQLGLQVAIRHLQLNKSYLLLQTEKGDFAIQTKFEKDLEKPSRFTYKKKCGKKKIAGVKCKKVHVFNENFKEDVFFYYSKRFSSKYLDGFESFPGLLTEYYVPTPDGIFKYSLTSMEEDPTNLDLYGVPFGYKRVTMDEFIELMTSGEK